MYKSAAADPTASAANPTAGAAGRRAPFYAPTPKPQLSTCFCLLFFCLFCGPPADNLLAKKANKHLLQDYDQRQAAAVGLMSLVRPSLSIAAGALTDPQVCLLLLCLVLFVVLFAGVVGGEGELWGGVV